MGIDEGSRHIGIAVVNQGKVLAEGEVEHRPRCTFFAYNKITISL